MSDSTPPSLGPTSIRAKRNFRGTNLVVSPSTSAVPQAVNAPPSSSGASPSSVPSTSASASLAPVSVRSRRPAPLLMPVSSVQQARPVPVRKQTAADGLTQQLAQLDVGKMELQECDMQHISDLGHGNGGTVTKVLHIPTGRIMAKKVVVIEAKPEKRKAIQRELQVLHRCKSQWIISFYGQFVEANHVCMFIEYADKGSLDNVSKKMGPLSHQVLGKITIAVLEGLTYLYDVHKIMHRDVKPSNILVNSRGEIKICDFGVSGELVNSIADTFVGTSTYMSPERIKGAQYSVASDVWSLGIALVELGSGGFPYLSADGDEDTGEFSTASPTKPSEANPTRVVVRRDGGGSSMSILELLQTIVNEPAPRLPNTFPEHAISFVDRCLEKDPTIRPYPKKLMQHPFYIEAINTEVDLVAWAATIP